MSAEPEFDAATAESYFREVYHSDPRVFQKPQWLQDAPPPRVPFNDSLFVQGELDIAIKKTKSSSSPSPHDQVPYLVFKRCPSLTKALLDLFNMCWRLQSVPSLWKMGVIRLIPKSAASQDPHLLSNFRPIALTLCVGKLFTTLMKNRWLQFMVANNYLDSSVQKAFLPGIPGCLEQHQKLLLMIADAHKKHRSLSVCWLDIANAYGSVHHQLITYCLQHYHAPSIFLNIVSNIYSDLSATITGPTWSTTSVPLRTGVYQGDPLSVAIITGPTWSTTSVPLRTGVYQGDPLSVAIITGPTWSTTSVPLRTGVYQGDPLSVAIITGPTWSTTSVPLRTGVYQGDPLSVGIFNTVMSTLAGSLRAHQHLGYTLSGGNASTNLLLYADDTCLIADGPASCQHLLLQVEKWLRWTGLSMKIPKYFYLNLQASTAKRTPIQLILQDQVILPVGEAIKFLGGPISVRSRRKKLRQQLEVKLAMMLKKVDDTAVSRRQKLLLYTAGICPRLLWDLAIGDLPISWVTTTLGAMATKFLKKWFGLAKPANAARLYLPQEDGGLALPPVSLLYKRMKLSQAILLLTSRDRTTQQVARRTLDKESSQRRAQFKPVTYS